jgi:hypothetical protein
MEPNRYFLAQPATFWANVRAISESIGYTQRGTGTMKIPSAEEMFSAMKSRGLDPAHLGNKKRRTQLGQRILEYFTFRAKVLNEYVEPRLMDEKRAKAEFQKLKKRLNPSPSCPFPMNKQKGKKKKEAFLTCMVNMLIEANANGFACDYDPRVLTTFTKDSKPLRTLARRVDGAFPSTVNPVAVWEIKEYYYTTTFGSRVADGVYETLLDGMELAELKEHEGINVLHYMIVDAHYTWWECGRSYLCRIMDALHMGLIDEVLFGYEVVERLPALVRKWVKTARKNK